MHCMLLCSCLLNSGWFFPNFVTEEGVFWHATQQQQQAPVDDWCVVDVLQRQRADVDTNAHHRRSDARTGADPRRGSRHARRLQHTRDAGTPQPLSHRSDATLRGHPLAVRGMSRVSPTNSHDRHRARVGNSMPSIVCTLHSDVNHKRLLYIRSYDKNVPRNK